MICSSISALKEEKSRISTTDDVENDSTAATTTPFALLNHSTVNLFLLLTFRVKMHYGYRRRFVEEVQAKKETQTNLLFNEILEDATMDQDVRW